MKKFNKNKRSQTNSNNKSNKKHYNKNKGRRARGPTKLKGRYVTPYEGESMEDLIKRFRRIVEASGVMRELKKREYYLSKSQKAREKKKRALKRLRRRDRAMRRNGD